MFTFSERPASTLRGALVIGVLSVALVVGACTTDDPARRATSTTTITVAPSSSVVTTTRTPTSVRLSATGFSPALLQSMQKMLDAQPGKVGLAIGPVGGARPAQVFGDLTTEVSWSTIKAPLALAALRADPEAAAPVIVPAIVNSDNAAAEQLWSMLGTPREAAAAVDEILAEAGDTTTRVQSQRVRSGFTAFGQTQWSLLLQNKFAAQFPCMPDSESILDLMGQVSGTQQWGVQDIEGAEVKGGWGPGVDYGYLVRQLAVVPGLGGQLAVTMATIPDAGTFEDGSAILDGVGEWVSKNLKQLPAGRCS